MNLVRYTFDETVAYGVLEEGAIVRQLAGSPFEPLKPSPTSHSVNEVRLLAPVDAPRIIGVGLNYVSHIRECNLSTPTFRCSS